MGWTFGNLHIQTHSKANADAVIQMLQESYAQFGYGVCEEEDAELSLAILDAGDSAWISVYSDFFEDVLYLTTGYGVSPFNVHPPT